ncbi:MAG: DUF6526 family protein [Acidobacteriaceae bacterium]|nr:DUF6526 family protein [Acidobacteriaceae bacterium]
MPQEQSFQHHAKLDPLTHYVLVPIFFVNMIVATVWAWQHRTHHPLHNAWMIVMATALLLLTAKLRFYALGNQNRIIRLEERLRLASLCTPSELVELDSLTTRQLIALRFASNPELPALARRAVRENLEPKAIKAAIQSWRADHQRV